MLDQANKKIAIGGLTELTKEVWTAISDNKDLQMPELREQAAEMRCNEVRNECIELVRGKIETLEKNFSNKFSENFKDDVENIWKEALDHYDLEAKQYKGKVFKKTKEEMIMYLAN